MGNSKMNDIGDSHCKILRIEFEIVVYKCGPRKFNIFRSISLI